MPGIVGYIDFNEVEKRGYLDNMLLMITHDTKYRIEKHEEPPLWIGRSDLAKFNPDPQPVFDHDKSMIAFFQGNITNKEEIQRFLGVTQNKRNFSNAQLILRLIEELDTEFVHKVKGHFTVFIWNRAERRLIIANDRFGRYPLYYTRASSSRLIFGSELKALFSHPSVKKKLNDQAIIDFVRFGWLWENETFFQNVYLLPYASVLQFGKGCLKIDRYWEYAFSEKYERISVDKYTEELNKLMKQAVKRALNGNHENVGILLSGGLDSRNIVANIPRGKRNVHTFTFGEKGSLDVRFAEKVSERLGFKHHSYLTSSKYIVKYGQMTTYIMDGMTYIFTGQNFIRSQCLDKEKVDLVLEGSSGNTIFGSFPITIKSFLTKKCETYSKDQLFRLLLKKLSIFNEAELKNVLSADYYCKVKGYTRKSFEESFNKAIELHKSPYNVADYIKFTQRLRRWLITARDSFRWRTETVDPFVDYDLVDFMLSVPPELRLLRRLYAETFKRHHPELARIPLRFDEIPMEYCLAASSLTKIIMMTFGFAANAIQRLLQSVTRGKPLPRFIKFPWDPVDYNEHLREQRDFVEKILLDERTHTRGLINPRYVKKLLDLHMARKKNYWKKLGVLVSLELWFRLFID